MNNCHECQKSLERMIELAYFVSQVYKLSMKLEKLNTCYELIVPILAVLAIGISRGLLVLRHN